MTRKLQTIRDSLNRSELIPETVANELLRVCSLTCHDTVEMVSRATDGAADRAQVPQSPTAALSEILNDDTQLAQLARAVAGHPQGSLETALQSLVIDAGSPPAGLQPTMVLADVGVTTQLSRVVESVQRSDSSFDASGFDLASVPGGVANSDSFSFQVIQPDEAPLEGLRGETGTLERAFDVRVDERGDPIVLGKGGMGYVLTGSPLSGGAEQAIKVCSDPKHEPRMLREFEILSQLTSEGFPLATGKYRDAQGQLCYSMKLVRGDSYLSGFRALHEVAKDPRSTNKNAVNFIEKYLLVERPADGFHQQDLNQIFKGLLERLIDVATAVSTMHKKGFIHRDLKPDNVRIELDTRHAVILDFGLAKVQDHEDLWADSQEFGLDESMHADLTRDGSVMGTLAYMSPEQASGNSDAHTKATDIYALGAMLYYLMTGKPAVSERDQHGNRRNPMEVLTQIRNGDIEPPVRLPCIRADFADLEAICSKAMAKDPSTRYGSADEMIIDLRAWVSGNAVKAYQEVISGGTQMRYRFHHWTRQNPGVWNAARTAALGVLTVVGGGGYYSASQNNKANAVASVAEGSLLRINEEVEAGLQQFLGSHTIETLPVEQLDRLVSKGEFEAFLKTERKRLADEILLSGGKDLDYFSRFLVVADIRSQAKKADAELEQIESVYKRRIASRAEMRQELEDFRTEFAPIRDFLGNDLETFMADPPQERIDSALARYLPAFRGQTSLQVSGQAPQIFFPECSKHVEELVVWCADQELSSSEAKEVKDSVAALLSYKVLNLQRTRATGFAPHVRPVLRRCSEYLEEARLLKGGEPSVFDLVLWERVASALEDPRATELQSKVKAVIELALSDETYAQQLSSQDLGILASELSDTYQFAEAQKLFDVVLRVGNADGADSAASLPSRYLGQFGRGFCLGSLARDAMSQGRKDAALEYLVEADYAFNRAYGLLSSLPDQSSDKRAKLATLYMALAKIQLAYWSLNENPVHLAQIRAAHEQARALASGPRLTRAIAVDLCNLGEFELAAAELSKALEVASYLASDLMPMRARCFAILGNEEKMLKDVQSILAQSTSTERAEEVEPKDLATCALALAEYIDEFGDRVSSEKERWYFETMKELLAGVKERCASGVPYTLAQLNLDNEFFTPLKEYDPAFWDSFVEGVSLSTNR